MGLMPEQFWSLTLREFHIKHAAFMRSEHRQRALVWELASMTASYKAKDRRQIVKTANALRQYPVKRWLR